MTETDATPRSSTTASPPRDALALAAAIRSGEADTRDVAEEAFRRIEAVNPALNAVVSTRREEALSEIADGLPDGPLRGVPILIKNLGADVRSQPATDGSRLFADVIAEVDSTVVQRYKAAGMVVLGTTNVSELGKMPTTESLLYGPCRNPWNTGYSTGGSSGGAAAAVASGMVPVAHGTDGGGSIRIPASACGLVGLKPSRGRVPTWPNPAGFASPVTSHHALTTTVRDSAALLDVVAGHIPGDAYGAPTPARPFLDEVGTDPGRLRIGLVRAAPHPFPTDPVATAMVDRTAAVMEELGHELHEVELGVDLVHTITVSGRIMMAQMSATIDRRLAELGRELRDDDLEPWTRTILDNGRGLSAADLNVELQSAQRIGWQLGELFAREGVDVILLPTIPLRVPELGHLDVTDPATLWTRAATYSTCTSLFNVSGQPAISLPAGKDENGLPVGVQFAADYAREDLLLRLAGQLETAAPWPSVAPGHVGW
ncbi:amidase [Dietzia aurantiaca]|uniref:amidase n=1 Tax=Dietzia aurantiaca TaxID=983873 RepID=UPI001E495B1B|nr:amidase [Dietzia aurantiaca]MCD2262271.1 amidase [Dietzia aurantiaca]